MLSALRSAWKKSAARGPRRPQPGDRRLGLEPLEDRALPSGGPGTSSVPTPPTSSPGGPSTQLAAVVSNSGGPDTSSVSSSTSGSTSGGGPGYPLPPGTGPVRPDPGTLTTTPPTTTLVPVTGTPGGPDPSLALVPVSTGGSPAIC